MAEQEANQQEKTEEATPKKRSDARKKGNVPKSVEINSAVILLAMMLILLFSGNYVFGKMMLYSKLVFENYADISINADNLPSYLRLAFTGFAKIIAPIMLSILVVGLAINYAQVGFLFTLEPLTPKFSKINPLSGLKRVLFSKKSLVELVKGILKIFTASIIAYLSISGVIPEIVQLMDSEPKLVFLFVSKLAFKIGIKIAIALLIMALLDLMFQRWDHGQKLKMTKQEVRDELKQQEGDPQTKARIRSIQREQARRRMMQDVPDADVVITNPTHLAIAVKYDPITMVAPLVVAKGAGRIAEKIKEIAEENDIPIVENKPLARALFKAVEAGDEIPEEFFQMVAEVLAYVYKLKGKKVA